MTPREIIAVVAARFNVSFAAITGRRRTGAVAEARAVAMWAIRNVLFHSYPQIGRYFIRDHTSALSACRRVSERMAHDEEFRNRVESIRLEIIDHPKQELPVCVECARREIHLREARQQLQAVQTLIGAA